MDAEIPTCLASLHKRFVEGKAKFRTEDESFDENVQVWPREGEREREREACERFWVLVVPGIVTLGGN